MLLNDAPNHVKLERGKKINNNTNCLVAVLMLKVLLVAICTLDHLTSLSRLCRCLPDCPAQAQRSL